MKFLLFLLLICFALGSARHHGNHHKGGRKLKPEPKLKPFDVKCSDCEEFVGEIVKALKDKTQVESLKMIAQKLVKDFDPEFEQYIDKVVEYLPQIIAAIEKEPELPCQYVGFCGNDRRGAMEKVRVLLITFFKESYKGTKPTCEECTAFGEKIKKNLPTMKKVGAKTLDIAKFTFCKGFSPDCRDFIDGFYNDIIADLEKGFGEDGKKVCKDVGICA